MHSPMSIWSKSVALGACVVSGTAVLLAWALVGSDLQDEGEDEEDGISLNPPEPRFVESRNEDVRGEKDALARSLLELTQREPVPWTGERLGALSHREKRDLDLMFRQQGRDKSSTGRPRKGKAARNHKATSDIQCCGEMACLKIEAELLRTEDKERAKKERKQKVRRKAKNNLHNVPKEKQSAKCDVSQVDLCAAGPVLEGGGEDTTSTRALSDASLEDVSDPPMHPEHPLDELLEEFFGEAAPVTACTTHVRSLKARDVGVQVNLCECTFRQGGHLATEVAREVNATVSVSTSERAVPTPLRHKAWADTFDSDDEPI